MHQIYHTDGIIIKSGNLGDSSKYYRIFTRDFGMIICRADGVRKITSKLRFVLQDFSRVKIDLIRSGHFWKITGVSKIEDESFILVPESLYSLNKIFSLLRRFIPESETNKILFEEIWNGVPHFFILDSTRPVAFLELAFVLRILSHLGYISFEEYPKEIFADSLMKIDLSQISARKSKIVSDINKAIRTAHL